MNEATDPKALDVEVTFLKPEHGGKSLRPNLSAGTYQTVIIAGRRDQLSEAERLGRGSASLFGVQFRDGPEVAELGHPHRVVIRSLVYPAGIEEVANAGAFTVCEGTRVVGHGRVLGRAV
jgi:hypothetical protein